MTHRNTRRERLERAGWVRIEGWLPKDGQLVVTYGAVTSKSIQDAIAIFAPEAERIATTGLGRGRPKKETAT